MYINHPLYFVLIASLTVAVHTQAHVRAHPRPLRRVRARENSSHALAGVHIACGQQTNKRALLTRIRGHGRIPYKNSRGVRLACGLTSTPRTNSPRVRLVCGHARPPQTHTWKARTTHTHAGTCALHAHTRGMRAPHTHARSTSALLTHIHGHTRKPHTYSLARAHSSIEVYCVPFLPLVCPSPAISLRYMLIKSHSI